MEVLREIGNSVYNVSYRPEERELIARLINDVETSKPGQLSQIDPKLKLLDFQKAFSDAYEGIMQNNANATGSQPFALLASLFVPDVRKAIDDHFSNFSEIVDHARAAGWHAANNNNPAPAQNTKVEGTRHYIDLRDAFMWQAIGPQYRDALKAAAAQIGQLQTENEANKQLAAMAQNQDAVIDQYKSRITQLEEQVRDAEQRSFSCEQESKQKSDRITTLNSELDRIKQTLVAVRPAIDSTNDVELAGCRSGNLKLFLDSFRAAPSTTIKQQLDRITGAGRKSSV